MKRTFVLFMISLLFAGGMALHAGGQSEDEAITLTWWHHQGPDTPTGARFAEMAERYEQENPGVSIEIETMPHSVYVEQLPVAIATGEMPDIYGMSYRDIFRYHEAGTMAPLRDEQAQIMGYETLRDFEASWSEGALDPYRIDGEYYGVPWEYNIYSFGINRDHFLEAGYDPESDYPRTWDEVFEIAEDLVQTDDAGRIRRPALSFPFSEADAWYMLELEAFVRMLGGTIMNEDGTETVINSAAGVQAMELIKERFDRALADVDISNSHVYNDAFATGEFSMGIIANWGTSRWPMQYSDHVDEDTFLAIPHPTLEEGDDPPIATTSWAFVVSSQSPDRQQEEAWRFLEFLTEDAGAHLAATGDVIPRLGWADTEAGQEYAQAEFWEEMVQYSIALTAFEHYPIVGPALERAMEEILLNNEDIQQTLDNVAEEINRDIAD